MCVCLVLTIHSSVRCWYHARFVLAACASEHLAHRASRPPLVPLSAVAVHKGAVVLRGRRPNHRACTARHLAARLFVRFERGSCGLPRKPLALPLTIHSSRRPNRFALGPQLSSDVRRMWLRFRRAVGIPFCCLRWFGFLRSHASGG